MSGQKEVKQVTRVVLPWEIIKIYYKKKDLLMWGEATERNPG